jgi:hypothetical protein
MSRWADAFAALSSGSDTLDTKRHSEVSRSILSQNVNSVTAAPGASEPVMPSTADRTLAAWGEAEQQPIVTASRPVLLRDGRRLHRFRAEVMPPFKPKLAEAALDGARCRGAVLVADGPELIVVEPPQGLSSETLQALARDAGAIIATLRGESRERSSGADA